MRLGNTRSDAHGVLNPWWVILLACVMCLATACGPDPNSDSPAVLPTAHPDGIGQSRTDEMNADKVRQVVRNIRSYLVDLEGALRAGAGDRFLSDASAARAILGNIRYETGILSQGGIDTVTIDSRVGTIEEALSSATKESWNNIVSKSKSEILEMQTALKSIGKGK